MTAPDDAALAYRNEQGTPLRQPETQRSVLANAGHYRRCSRLAGLRPRWLCTGPHLGVAVSGLALVILTTVAG